MRDDGELRVPMGARFEGSERSGGFALRGRSRSDRPRERRGPVTPPIARELYGWPAVVPLWPDAASVYGLSRTSAFDLAKRGEFPCRVLSLGRLLKVSTSDLMASLGMPLNPPNDETPAPRLPAPGVPVVQPATYAEEMDRAHRA